jgi:hypothetical protein
MKVLWVLLVTFALAAPQLGYARDSADDAAMPSDRSAPEPGTAPDNTGANVRDRGGETLTPMDQTKGSDADVETTQQVRKAIVGDDSLSTSAHNVKIITLNGVTTLRGPVASAEEKTRVAQLAAKAAGDPKKIKNELEVAP